MPEVTNATTHAECVVHVVNEIIMPTNFLSDAIADGLTPWTLYAYRNHHELSVPANYTVFAPTDSAIMAF